LSLLENLSVQGNFSGSTSADAGNIKVVAVQAIE
jgi:hypothetical protein